ncbi:hypothetical protein BGZ92_003290 [Podila epicladia]|nr:hypothetical protein BGZ92_003290 [Podila epicladia]
MHLSIFEIPFIQDDIVSYLASNDLKQCCLVSKAWLGFFNPYLWQSMTLWETYYQKESQNAQCLAVLQKNMHHVKTLNDLYCDHSLIAASSGVFPRLRTFISHPPIYHGLQTYNQILKLIGLHPQLHSFTLKVWDLIDPLASDLAQAIKTHPGPKEFRLFGHTLSLTAAQDVMFACRHLETLVWGLRYRGMPPELHVIELAKERDLMRATAETRIKRLDIDTLSTYSTTKLLVPLLHRCTYLEYLRFTMNCRDHWAQELAQLKSVITERCPSLKYLGLLEYPNSYFISDPVSAILSRTTRGLEFLETNIRKWTPSIVKALSDHHSHTLKSIQLTTPMPVEYFVQIASSCVNLKILRCERGLSLESFRINGKQLVKIRWNCQGLRQLQVRWGHTPADWPPRYRQELLKYMGKQIGRLANLQELEIDGKDLASLQYGRLRLGNLRQLRTLVVLDTFKDVKWSAEDAEWMLEHWPRLVRIEGREGDHLAEAFEVLLHRRPWLETPTRPIYCSIRNYF